ncbi:MAG TPA: bi-domain-containing oxidoreductase [Nitrospirota bacterium]|nr:bi-domain-containing oxidoreductase [Nitrospirota bacterium]
MHQLTQTLKDGKMQILEVPVPAQQAGHVLVRNHYSLISVGTDTSTVKAARSSLIEKAKARPQQVRQVMDVIQSQGLTQAYRAVMKKLDAYSPLGYSSSGEIVSIGERVTEFAIGDHVACGGLTASHAEFVSVPVNLCVKLQRESDLRQAAYNTLGAIAMQGVRQADLRLGETCAVIGLGLLGQLSSLLLRASGIRVIGIDIDPTMVETAGKHCVDIALQRNADGIEDLILQFTQGIGCDGVIITAATDTLDPINFAGAIARKRGTIVVVGAVPTGFDRDPYFYRKELQVRMSCSYGPGRYDPQYEVKGIDYPAAYVRWTEKRNMEAFQELLSSGKMDVSYLTTHVFKLDDAQAAYDMMLSKAEPVIGILIEYDVNRPVQNNRIMINRDHGLVLKAKGAFIGFIGAGSYAQSHLLPNIAQNDRVKLVGVMTVTGTGSRSVGDRFGFEFCVSNEQDILETENINTVFIATRHESHADYVLKALRAGKHVFLEKPLCTRETELAEIAHCLRTLDHSPLLMVGYNRRFSPLAMMIKDKFGSGSMAMIYRVNAGAVPADSWMQDPEIGGGRIIGEVCHFVDFLTFMNGSLPVHVHAQAMKDARNLQDVVNISLSYENGSIGTISYLSNGDKGLPKERVEIYAHGCTAVIDDFKTLAIYSRGKKKERGLLSQDKGQKSEVRTFLDSVIKGQKAPIPFEELYSTSLVTFKVMESLRTGMSIHL